MNGRLYDPKLHRFLAPDNFIQDISNTQNFNRYGYVLNNPLMYTDPSGENHEMGHIDPSRTPTGVEYLWAMERNSAFWYGDGGDSDSNEINPSSKPGFTGYDYGSVVGTVNSASDPYGGDDLFWILRNEYLDGRNDSRPIQITNNTKSTIYYKPEGIMTVNGVTYQNNGAYPVEPSQSSTIPFDGVNVNGVVTKVSDGYNHIIINPNGSIETFYTNPFNWLNNQINGGVLTSPPDNTWQNLFNAINP